MTHFSKEEALKFKRRLRTSSFYSLRHIMQSLTNKSDQSIIYEQTRNLKLRRENLPKSNLLTI